MSLLFTFSSSFSFFFFPLAFPKPLSPIPPCLSLKIKSFVGLLPKMSVKFVNYVHKRMCKIVSKQDGNKRILLLLFMCSTIVGIWEQHTLNATPTLLQHYGIVFNPNPKTQKYSPPTSHDYHCCFVQSSCSVVGSPPHNQKMKE